MDTRQNQKRGIANIPGGKEASSPTERRSLITLDTDSSRAKELDKITELAGTDFPAMAESDAPTVVGFGTTAHLRPHL
ncbi:hypothetical protein LTS10_013282 [Elasticomyces elasticus]|nr:hypothetical protein LTS10_013282 [Elasticomyces elasticus]